MVNCVEGKMESSLEKARFPPDSQCWLLWQHLGLGPFSVQIWPPALIPFQPILMLLELLLTLPHLTSIL